MLARLMKHELKATARLLVPLYIVLLCVSVINRFTLQSGMGEGIALFFRGLLIATQIISIIAILMVTLILMILRFYRNLLKDEGYLMFTLPVRVHHLITSKLVITVFWIIISLTMILGSLGIVSANPGMLDAIWRGFKEMSAELSAQFGGNGSLLLVEFTTLVFLGVILNILLIYVSIAVGQLFNKNRVVASFVSYIVIYTGLQFLITLVGGIFIHFNIGNIDLVYLSPQIIFPVGILFALAGCTIFYAVTNHILTKKLNLE
jgi:hypothetical protein